MKRTSSISLLYVLSLAVGLSACDKDEGNKRPDLKAVASSKAPAKAVETNAPVVPKGRVFFVKPKDGGEVPERFEVEFGVEGKQIEPAGATVRDPLKGHHHLLIDSGPLPDMKVVPKDEKNLHYGDGSTKALVQLPPGEHKITAQFADGAHQSYGPDWAQTITIKVVAGDGAAAGGDTKAGDTKAAEAKAGEAKAGEAKAGEAKAGGAP